ncbi:MAG: hypothetical protein ACI4WH_07155 [Oscillospiraceae bacterium]
MKNILICLIVATLMFSFTSCKEIETSNVSNVSMKSGIVTEDFSIYVPEDYMETSSKYIEKYYVKDNSASIIVTNDTNIFQYNNIDDYYENSISQYKSTFDEFNEISSQNITVDGNYTAKLSEFTYKIVSEEKDLEMSCYVEYILVRSSIYIVTCSAPTSTYPSYKDGFIKALDSIKIT